MSLALCCKRRTLNPLGRIESIVIIKNNLLLAPGDYFSISPVAQGVLLLTELHI
ncbi:hypothetical protein O59_001011 [Cellvibrio sp. BR]|nr:hypothetical protein O59_001011 [Cellvibrio sp. BR]